METVILKGKQPFGLGISLGVTSLMALFIVGVYLFLVRDQIPKWPPSKQQQLPWDILAVLGYFMLIGLIGWLAEIAAWLWITDANICWRRPWRVHRVAFADITAYSIVKGDLLVTTRSNARPVLVPISKFTNYFELMVAIVALAHEANPNLPWHNG